MPCVPARCRPITWLTGFMIGLSALSVTALHPIATQAIAQTKNFSNPAHGNAYLASVELQATELAMLRAGGVVTRALPSTQPKVIAAQGMAVVNASPDALLEAYRSLEVIRHGASVIACGRFSCVPTQQDVVALPVSEGTLAELTCARIGDASVKLSESEIERLGALRQAYPQPQMRRVLADAYRQMLWERALNYATRGQSGLPRYADKKEHLDAYSAAAALLAEQVQSCPGQATVCTALRQFPAVDEAHAESFLYWAVQKYGDLKPVTTVVHVLIWRDRGRDYVVSRLVYANHYTEAALVLAEFIPCAAADGQPQTLVAYSIRVQTDLLGGQLGFLKKRFAQSKLTSTLKGGLASLRTVVESNTVARRDLLLDGRKQL